MLYYILAYIVNERGDIISYRQFDTSSGLTKEIPRERFKANYAAISDMASVQNNARIVPALDARTYTVLNRAAQDLLVIGEVRQQDITGLFKRIHSRAYAIVDINGAVYVLNLVDILERGILNRLRNAVLRGAEIVQLSRERFPKLVTRNGLYGRQDIVAVPTEEVQLAIYNNVQLQYHGVKHITLEPYSTLRVVARDQKEVQIPHGTKVIPDRAFYNNGAVREIVLPETVIFIGNEAFAGAYNLRSVVMPTNPVGIGEGIFNGCTALRAAGQRVQVQRALKTHRESRETRAVSM